ncbi:MAG TPA: hypothetical protein VFV87_17355, partial [Pirellulaceae bacterium]|nr:hypothetical protein [Pirellulaceae bacterium]
LPTSRSRCQIVPFRPLTQSDVEELLLQCGLCEDRAVAQQAAARSGGSVAHAAQWCEPELIEFRSQLLDALANPEMELLQAAKLVGQFVEGAGKESAAKRDRLRLAVSLAEEFYRSLLLGDAALCDAQDKPLTSAIARASRWIAGQESAAACLDVCLDAYAHIDSNVNQATFIEWWLDELSQAARRGAGFQPAR